MTLADRVLARLKAKAGDHGQFVHLDDQVDAMCQEVEIMLAPLLNSSTRKPPASAILHDSIKVVGKDSLRHTLNRLKPK